MIDFTSIESARVAFKQLYSQVQAIFSWDIKGNRLQNIADGAKDQDAVSLKQLNNAIAAIKTTPTGPDNLTQTVSNLRIITSLNPTVDDAVDLGTTSLRFKELWAYLIDIATTIKFSGLSTNLPLKLDSSKNVISAGIDLSSATEVLNTLPENRGGTGTTVAGVNGAIGLTQTTSTVVTNVIGNTTIIQYKDWAGTNQSLAVVTSLTVFTATGLLTSVIDANAFTKGKKTT